MHQKGEAMNERANGRPVIWKNPDTDWLHDAGYGLFLHFLSHDCPTSAEWNDWVEQFDVEAVAQQAAEVGAGYLAITLGQTCSGVLAPNATLDRILGVSPGDYCAQRDLPLDLGRALEKRGVELLLYAPGQWMREDPYARRLLGWDDSGATSADWVLTEAGRRKWCEIMREWSLRYGTMVKGWWLDGCRTNRGHTNDSLARYYFATKVGNPHSVVGINPGASFQPFARHFDYQDFIAGHDLHSDDLTDEPIPDGRWVDGAQWHALLFMGSRWGERDRRFSSDAWAEYARRVTDRGGIITFDCGPRYPGEPDEGAVGTISDIQMKQLRVIRDAVR